MVGKVWLLLCLVLGAAEILPEDECSSGSCSLELHQLRAQEGKLEAILVPLRGDSWRAQYEEGDQTMSNAWFIYVYLCSFGHNTLRTAWHCHEMAGGLHRLLLLRRRGAHDEAGRRQRRWQFPEDCGRLWL